LLQRCRSRRQAVHLGELDGAIPRAFLAKGKANASDAKESDEEDDEEAELKPFKFQFDAKGFLTKLPAIDGEPLAANNA